MNTDVLFESGKTAAKALKFINEDILSGAVRYIISPFRPEGLEKEKHMLLLPYVLRSENEEALSKLIKKERPERILIRNMEELGFLKCMDFGGEIHSDASLYSFNRESIMVLKSLGVKHFTCPYELDLYELRERGCDSSSMVIYGRTPLMVSAQCTYKTGSGKCRSERDGFLSGITDRKKVSFPVWHECRYCYNLIYNSVPLSLFKEEEELLSLSPDSLRLDFTTESPEEASKIIKAYVCRDRARLSELVPTYTKGHLRKGTE